MENTEYIRKRDAIDMCGGYIELAYAMAGIEPADVVPVIRCDNCKYYGSRRWCELHSSVFDDNAFCSYGEKKGLSYD